MMAGVLLATFATFAASGHDEIIARE